MALRARWWGALGALVLVAGCGTGEPVDLDDGGAADGGGSGNDVLVAAIAGEPDQLDPHRTSSYFAFQVLENVFDTLVEPDEDLAMQPALAESWEISDDQLTWTFQIREGVTWHDGSAFSAQDVAYSFNRIIDEELSPSWRFANVSEVTAPDDTTVVITVTEPSPTLLSAVGGYKGLAIVQQANVESGEITTNPVGTGPFELTGYTSGTSIELTANQDWWGGAPAIGGVTFRFVPEPTTAMAEVTSGDVDWTDNVPPQQTEQIGNDDQVVLGQSASNDYWYLTVNQTREPFDDVRVRQAIAYAIDREAITQVTMYGNATVNQLAIPETSAWYTEYEGYSYDPDTARDLLAEAGVGDLTLTMITTDEYPETGTAGSLIAAQLAEVGITVQPESLPWAEWLDRQGAGEYDMFMLGWLGNLDPDDFYYAQHHTGAVFNFQGYSNPQVDEWLDQARVETDDDARQALYDQAATLIADDASYIYLYNPDTVQVWNPRVEGYTVRGDGAIRFRDVTLGG